MDYKERISLAIDYIEQNLSGEISLADCAAAAGYSVYHFLRIFKEAVSLTPADYIRKRRLSEAAKEIAAGGAFISESAFKYGFNSKENFVRAFKAEHHILPTEYKFSLNSLKLYEKLSLEKADFAVVPEIVVLENFELTVYKSDEEYVPNFWNKYNSHKYSKKLSGGISSKDYGVCSYVNGFEYFAGIRTEFAKGDTSGARELKIPGGSYALFKTPKAEHYNFVSTIHRTWEYIGREWFPQSGYKRTGGLEFECYNEDSRTFSENIYIPL